MSRLVNLLLLSAIIISLSFRENSAKENPSAGETFTNPLLASAADPWVVQKDGWYYITHTTGRDLRLYRTKKINALAQAESKTVWTPPASGMNSKEIWAPELHYINNKWYFYYAADNGDNNNHRMWVLENASADPFQGAWVDKGMIQLPDNTWAIDGTIFEHNGTLYFMWSGWEGTTNVRQDIYIVKMSNPWTATGSRIRLSKPEYDWELHGGSPTVNEGPQVLKHNNKVFVIYSASGCWTDNYCLGLLTADAAADLMNSGSWTKSTTPVFQSNPEGQAYAPGHNSFFKSPDGTEDWIAYHANPAAGQGCSGHRSMRIQRFSWKEDGTPYFDTPVALGISLNIPSEKSR